MTIILKILLSLAIFSGGVWLTATLVVSNAGKRPIGGIGGLVVFPAAIAGIVAVWKFTPKRKVVYEDIEDDLQADQFMEFVDYYQLLQLDTVFTDEQLKTAYKKQAIKWHPDKNPTIDTTLKMQQINEAFLILNDYYSRQRYEQEYLKYQKFCEQLKKQERKSEYKVEDEALKAWILKARLQAAKIAKQSMKDMISMSVASGKVIISQIVVRAVFFISVVGIFSLLFKACE
jgi:hypothetical protein